MAPLLPAPPWLHRRPRFPSRDAYEGAAGTAGHQGGDTGCRGTDGEIFFFTFSCSFGNDPVVFLNQRMNKHFRVKGGLDQLSLKQVSDEPDDTEL